MIFHNVERLGPHYQHIKSDHTFMSTDILAFVEPWLTRGEIYVFPDHKYIFNQVSETTKSSGSYLASKLEIQDYCYAQSLSNTGHFTHTSWSLNGKLTSDQL